MKPSERWRLLLGEAADGVMGSDHLDGESQAMDAALDWLYDRDPELAERDVARSRKGGSESSALTVPEWIDQIHRLFPHETIERLERDAVVTFGIDEVVTNVEVLERIEPNETLLRAVLRTKHLMNADVLHAARRLVEQVVRQLMEKLAQEVQNVFFGTPERRRRSPLRVARNLDLKRTLRENLRRYDPERRKLYVEKPYFFARVRRHTERWQIVILVDQSGSMLSSVIHSSVTAACLRNLPGMRTHLVAFDTEVVDLTEEATDPVELLMKVQLGGGTDIARAVGYAAELLEMPERSIVVVISDFFEGGSQELLVKRVRSLAGQGTKVLGLAALDEEARPDYDRDLAQRLVDAGAEVGAMTPGELADWIAEKIGE